MKTYIFAVSLACTFLLSKTSPAKEANIAPRIFKGTAARPGQFPWLAALVIKKLDDHITICAGSLIAPKWVLTAANCVYKAKRIKLHFGGVTLDPLEKGKTVLVSKYYIMHPDYSGVDNNVALIRLTETLNTTSRIRPIALPDADQTLQAGVEVIVSGFGQTKKTANDPLNYAKMTTLSNKACGRFYFKNDSIDPSRFCAIGKKKENACNSDNGAVAVTLDKKNRATLVGVLAFTGGCNNGNPSGFNRIALFRKWIGVYTDV